MAAPAPELPELVVYTYDSFVAKGGLGPELFPLFEKKCGCKVRAVSVGDSGQMLTRLQLDAERGKPVAHVALGLDQIAWERAKPWLEDGAGWEPRGYGAIPAHLKAGAGFVPFDYGVFAFMVDRQALAEAKLEAPKKLSDLLEPEWKRRVILQDPRTSGPGLAFLLYANQVGGEGFWKKFRSQWLTLAPGWDAAYGLFLKKEAPLVWSYTTSQAYHDDSRYQAVVFEEGQPLQVEGAALVKGTGSRELARGFLEFLISEEAQALVPSKNWMLPVLPGVKLPAAFAKLPAPRKIVKLPKSPLAVNAAIAGWRKGL